MRRQLYGFTFFELLVVIIIVTVLAVLIFPVISRHRESANNANCISNLKKIGEAWRMYASDYDGQMCPLEIPENGWTLVAMRGLEYLKPTPGPKVYWSHRSGNGAYSEEGLLFPYMKGSEILFCKSASNVNRGSNLKTSYAMNQHLDNPYGQVYTGTNYSKVEWPAETIMIADAANAVNDNAGNPFKLWTAGSVGLQFGRGRVHARHDGLANIVWIDGHVSAHGVDYPPALSSTPIPGDPTPEVMERFHLGDILKVARECAYGYYIPPYDSTDFYYYLTTKPPLD